MSTLHVRSVPDTLYNQIQQLAEEKNRSLSAQVIKMLSDAMEQEKKRSQQAELLSSIYRRRFAPPVGATSSVELLREDRER